MKPLNTDMIRDNIETNPEAAQRFLRNDYAGLIRDRNRLRRIDRKALLKGIESPSQITDANLKLLIR